MRLTRAAQYIPLGGSTPLGTLGHVNAALELADQVERGELPLPGRVVVPLGSGGTAAGLALGFAIAGLDTGRHWRAGRAAHWRERVAGTSARRTNTAAHRAVYWSSTAGRATEPDRGLA